MKSGMVVVLAVFTRFACAATCDSLTSLSLTNTTITQAQSVAAGAFTPPPAAGRRWKRPEFRRSSSFLPRAGDGETVSRFGYSDRSVAARRHVVERQAEGNRERRIGRRHRGESRSSRGRDAARLCDRGQQYRPRGRFELRNRAPGKDQRFRLPICA